MQTDQITAALEAAEGPSRELDEAIERATGNYHAFSYYKLGDDDQPDYTPTRYTSSIGAALTMVPEGCAWHISSACPRDACATIESGDDRVQDFTGKAATPAIALCIAALRARGEA